MTKKIQLKVKDQKIINITGVKIIGIVGSRRRNHSDDYELLVKKFFEIYKEGDIICSGGCNLGADFFAYDMHKLYDIPYLEFPAKWKKEGKPAGAIRNIDIALWSHILIALVAPDRTGGTEITIDKFLNKFKKTNIHIL